MHGYLGTIIATRVPEFIVYLGKKLIFFKGEIVEFSVNLKSFEEPWERINVLVTLNKRNIQNDKIQWEKIFFCKRII